MTTFPCDSPEDFCITHGYEHMRRRMGNPVPFCEACETERSLISEEEKQAVACHCGKDGHALNSVNCPVHGYTVVPTAATGSAAAMLELAERINRSYLVTLNANGVTERNLSGDDISYIVAALRIVAGSCTVSSNNRATGE